MPDKIALMAEADRRGLLSPQQSALLAEARRRGLVADAGSASSDQPAQPQQSRAERWADLQRRAAQLAQSDPTAGMSGLDRAAAGVGLSLAETARGARQLIGDAFHSGTDMLALITGQDPAARRRETVDAQRRLDAPLLDTGAGLGGYIGGTVGQVLVPGGVAKMGLQTPRLLAAAPRIEPALQTVKAASLPSSVRGSTAQGGLLGLLQPVGEGESRMQNATAGGVLGLLGAGIPRAVGALRRGTGSMVGRVTRGGAENRAAQIIRAEADRPAALMRPAPSQIPGVQRTLAEETLDPGIARLERQARSTGRGWDILDRTNNAARVAAIRQFAGDEAAIEAAKRSRDAVAIPALERARLVQDVDTAPLLQQLDQMIEDYTGNPAVQDGLRMAKVQMEKAGGNLAHLENVRQFIGRLISGTANNNGAKLHELMDAKGQLVDLMGAASPDFETYLRAYAEGSRPINRMQIGQSLLTSRSGSAILDPVTGEQVLTPAAFSGRARNLDRVAQEATQFKRARAADYLEPEDLATISNVQDDLERRAFAATAGSGGNSQTFERMALNDRLTGGFASRLPIVGRAVEYLGQIGETRLQATLSEMLASPDRARAILQRLPAQDRRVIENALSRTGGSIGALLLPVQK